MDALELALKCSSLLIRSMSTRSTNMPEGGGVLLLGEGHPSSASHANEHLHGNDSDFEKHFKDHGKTAIEFNYKLSY